MKRRAWHSKLLSDRPVYHDETCCQFEQVLEHHAEVGDLFAVGFYFEQNGPHH